MAEDNGGEATVTTTTTYDNDGNVTGTSVSKTEPAPSGLESWLNESLQTGVSIMTLGAVPMPGENSGSSDGDNNS